MIDCTRRRAVALLLRTTGAVVLTGPLRALHAAGSNARLPRHARLVSPFRVAILTPRDAAAAAGATFGLAEVARTAAALGAAIEAMPATSVSELRAMLRDGRVHAVIVDGGAAGCGDVAAAARAAGAACVEAWRSDGATACGTAAQITARVAPDDAARAAILARYATEQGGRLVREPGDVRVELAGGGAGGEVLRVVAWHPSLEKYGGAQLNARFVATTHRPMDERAWCGWAATKLLGESFLRVASAAADAAKPGTVVRDAILAPTLRFDGQKGRPLAIRSSDHALVQPLYVVRAPASAGAAPVDGRVIAEVAPEGAA